jgi:hypothetical protein
MGYKAGKSLGTAVQAMETHKSGRFVTAVIVLTIASVTVSKGYCGYK